MPPIVEYCDTEVTVDGRPHYLFVQAGVEPLAGTMTVLQIGLVIKPT